MITCKVQKTLLLVFLIILIGIECWAQDNQNELKQFMAKPEPAYKWALNEKIETKVSTFYNFSLTSLTFNNKNWNHTVNIIVPKVIKTKGIALILNAQGKSSDDLSKIADISVALIGCPLIMVWDVPNTNGGTSEDSDIANSLLAAINTKDVYKAINLPMAKAVLKAMDMADEFLPTINITDIKKYVITGGSKNGWTCWLAAASGDKRIAGIAPIVFDFLDINKQLDMQKEMYGNYSQRINDYTSVGMPEFSKTPEGRKLINTVDPITYIDEIKIPKLIINATNDSFWTINSANIYWNRLKGDKYLLYMPNQDHNTRIGGGNINPIDMMPVLTTLLTFVGKCAGYNTMDNIQWTWEVNKSNVKCNIKGINNGEIINAQAYINSAPTKDFRASKFDFTPMNKNNDGTFSIEIPQTNKYQTAICQVTIKNNNIAYSVFTTPQIIEKSK